jgi:hypothetical protein
VISDAAAHEGGCEFNFSMPQWGAILKAVGEGCLNPLHFKAITLLERANIYLKDQPHHEPASRRAAEFRRRAKITAAFRAMVTETADSRECWFGPLREQERRSFLSLIDRFAGFLEFAAERVDGQSGPDHPRMKFYEAIFSIWLEAGGGLRRSRGHEAGGPLVRYVQAVTGPVMGEDAPKLETIPGMISEAKKPYQREGFSFDKHGRWVFPPGWKSLYMTPPGWNELEWRRILDVPVRR